MDWLDRLNQSINYIEENLAGVIDFEKAAEIACCSVFHYQRMFSYIANVPLSEYIRRRRMTIAALELQNSDVKVIDLAFKFGYNSPTSFTRAFENVHGVSPTLARKKGTPLKSYFPMTFKIMIKGDIEMNYRMEKKEAFRIVGVKEHLELNVDENFMRVPEFWRETVEGGIIPKLCDLMNQQPMGILGVSTCMNGKDLDYYIACSTDRPALEGTYEYEIPAATWAIFECIGPMPYAIQDLQKRIITEWLPTSGYEYANAPDIEVYTEGDQTSADYRSEVWLPIVKKNA